MSVYESDLEAACLGWFAQIGYEVLESDHPELVNAGETAGMRIL